MHHFKTYKRAIKYILDVQLFTYSTQQEQCRYAGHFLIGTSAEQLKFMEKLIKTSPDPIYNYLALIEMLKERLLLGKVRQIKVGTKLKALRQKDN